MSESLHDSLAPLALADPELAGSVAVCLAAKKGPVSPELMDVLVAETIWALGVEISFGRAVAAGLSDLIGDVPEAAIETYRRRVGDAGNNGPSQGRIMAECLPAVLKHGDGEILARFRKAWDVMARKGSYTLSEPLLALGDLLGAGEIAAARVYLELLQETFAKEIAYAECRYFSTALPKAALGFARARRAWQLAELLRVIRVDHRLAEPLLAGFGKGLALLSEKALFDFVTGGLARCGRGPDLGRRHLALESRAGQEHFAGLQVSVGLIQLQDRLQRYLHARTGLALAIRPLSALSSQALPPDAMVCSDGQAIYLPNEIGRFSRKQENVSLYTLLVRLEASFYEFGTVDFDLERAIERCRPYVNAAVDRDTEGSLMVEAQGPSATGPDAFDLERFFGFFPDKALAVDLFTVFELGRIRRRLDRQYPGMVRRFFPLLRLDVMSNDRPGAPGRFLFRLLDRIALAGPEDNGSDVELSADPELSDLFASLEATRAADVPVEHSAELTARFFGAVLRLCRRENGRQRLTTPFGWRPWPNPALAGAMPYERLAGKIRDSLAGKGLKTYKADIRRRLAENGGTVTLEDIRALCGGPELDAARVEEILNLAGRENPVNVGGTPDGAPAFRYREWDVHLGDYLQQHVLLRERTVPAAEGRFYADVLSRRHGLFAETRRAFERMRPEGLKRLRGWPDGDEFDYRQLIERFVDRRTGNIPADRLFIKRVKEQRDVAILLLVDLSRSTANTVAGSDVTVLAVEKEAIVVLCEALNVLGDAFAVAGFSGTGRLGVDYFRIKGFEEPMSDDVARRIGALSPQRNTRMGAAIRHAGRELEKAMAKVRLLVMLSDGFPNDADYKHRYAVADTRQALLELSSRRIRFHALTVSLPAGPRLDELYGKARHHVISDVRELPVRLLRVYSALTRF